MEDEARLAALRSFEILDTSPETGFDDVVTLATQICDAPVALVSLVDRDRQWFKARRGFALAETPISQSVCQYALRQPELLVIPDLARDERTAANTLVTGKPHLRFYAGAPLVTPDGHTLGTLCVLDHVARSDGLTSVQAEGLSALARQVMQLLVSRRAAARSVDVIGDLAQAERALRDSEAKWRGLFESLSEGFILGSVIRDEAGRVVDWRYEEMNRSWGELMSLDPRTATGRTVREILSHVEEAWVQEIAGVVETGEPARFTRQVGSIGRWYEGVAQAVGGDRFTVLFQEVTDRIKRDHRQAALLTLGDELRDRPSLDEIVLAAARCVADGLEADRVGFGTVSAAGDSVDVQTDWCEPGMSSLAGGALPFRTDGAGHTGIVAVDDITLAVDYSAQRTTLAEIDAKSFMGLTINRTGHPFALVFAHSRSLRSWTDGEKQFMSQISDRVQVAVSRVEAEESQRVLNRELAHRMKNTLAMVQAIATQTLRQTTSMEEGRKAIGNRLSALARAQDILTGALSDEADVRSVVEAAIRPHRTGEGRISSSGPSLRLSAQQALGLSLAIHELATNAAKYGALSNETGRVTMNWAVTDGRFEFSWVENDGPNVAVPERRGFGSKLIEQIVAAYFNGEGRIDFKPGGIRFELTGSL
ncbi:HWE histidine kinase domain-containing protein [Aureimonas jatrophae]|uniref:HWE histidine kinase domain-containing protein n=1 Tax=Aureimonas jatrophae TaxID=1166073 RepID=UPI001479FADB|nr:HWE histidine kinase domain-containing protein [Aureimonas jatrophae]MBB3951845.1 two-component sensor histidine kinase/PAS domain-containing protein [Aureimonas jatrophae]